MSGKGLLDTAVKYRVEDIKGAVTPGGQLANILVQLEAGVKISNTFLAYLDRKGFFALKSLGAGDISFEDYLPNAEQEQVSRRAAAAEVAQRAKSEAESRERERLNRERLEREQYEAAQRALMSDPRYQAKIRESELKEKYGLNEYVDPADYPKLMGLVRVLDRGNRIGPEDFAWLSAHGWNKYSPYLTLELETRYHRIEARSLADEFSRTGDSWCAVNASKHFRKCGQSEQAKRLLEGIDVSRIRDVKLKSALCTTRGGVMRDLGGLDVAFELGCKAHDLTPRDFRPCTLLGAVSYERGDCEQGRVWYEKAVKRGFDEAAVDGELKSIFFRLDPKKQAVMRAHLLGMDTVRYKWVEESVTQTHRAKITTSS